MDTNGDGDNNAAVASSATNTDKIWQVGRQRYGMCKFHAPGREDMDTCGYLYDPDERAAVAGYFSVCLRHNYDPVPCPVEEYACGEFDSEDFERKLTYGYGYTTKARTMTTIRWKNLK